MLPNLGGFSKLLEFFAYIIPFIDKSHTNRKLFNMTTLNLVSKDGKKLGLLYLIDLISL